MAILLAGALAGVAVPQAATSAPAPTCTFSGEVVLDPGLSAAPSSGIFATEPGRDGSYRCSYRYGPAKTGRASTHGRYGTADGDSCPEGGEGEGSLRFGDAHDDGDTAHDGDDGDFTFTYTPFSDGVATGEFHSRRFNGTLTLTAVTGDCALSPVTRVRLEGTGTPES